MVTYHICNTDSLWSKFSLFYLQHRHEVIDYLSVEETINGITDYFDYGHVFVGLNEQGEVIGFTSCTIGQRAQNYKNKEVAVLHNSYVLPAYQSSRTFIRGLHLNVEEIGKTNPQVKEVRIHAAVKKPYLQRLYSKIARKLEDSEQTNELCIEYVTAFDDLLAYCRRFGKALSSRNE